MRVGIDIAGMFAMPRTGRPQFVLQFDRGISDASS